MIRDTHQCPIPCCHKIFSIKTGLLNHLKTPQHSTVLHLADGNTCRTSKIYQCCQHSCPTAPKSFFASLDKLTTHHSTHHKAPPSSQHPTYEHHQTTPITAHNILTNLLHSRSTPVTVNNWTHGLAFINITYKHDPSDFRNTWQKHIRH
jgi:hypothetical protein